MMKTRQFASLAVLALCLAACGKKDQTANNASEIDPAIANALEDQIMVDPNLAAQSNRFGARGNPMPGRAPLPETNRDGGTSPVPSGKVLNAPPPVSGAGSQKITLGQMAKEQVSRRRLAKKADCDRNFQYSMAWAAKLPEAFPIYPGGQVTEAAGNNIESCRMRLVSFTSTAPAKTLIDYYYTQAVRNGFNAEHQLVDGEHILAGAREKDDGAYYLVFNPAKGGVTEVDMIVNHGR